MMATEYFVNPGSIVRRVWGKSDTIFVIFAGASAEFALSRAVDWLYFTGKLPSDPLGRMFSTVAYARKIVFAEKRSALKAIDTITAIHKAVEGKRGAQIPDWAYRDVLFMLIDYSIRSFELLERKLTLSERREIFDVFLRVGERMDINGLPHTYEQWMVMRQEHLQRNLEYSRYTDDLFRQYRKHLGTIRYRVLIELQTLVVPVRVASLMRFRNVSLFKPLISLYKGGRRIQADKILKALVLPSKYRKEIRELDGMLSKKV